MPNDPTPGIGPAGNKPRRKPYQSVRKPGEKRGRKGKGDVEKMKELRVEALRLRQAGASYNDIAGALKVSKPTAIRYVKMGLRELDKQFVVEAELYRTLELSRLDRHERALAVKCSAGDRQAIETSIKIMERRAKLLGLDRPDKHEHEHKFRSGMETLIDEIDKASKASPATPPAEDSPVPSETGSTPERASVPPKPTPSYP